jgi:probable HAF family extracellular repeat protein
VLREIYSLIRALLRASGVETKGSSEQATLTWLGTLGDDDQTLIISADGSVVVGWAESADGHQRAFRWTADGGMEDLGTLGGDCSWATGVSADGSVVVGWAKNVKGDKHAFRWTADGGIEDLGTLGGRESTPEGISADGSVVVGWADNAAGNPRAFRWTADGGMEALGTLGGDCSWATGVSADGSVVVGWAENAEGDERAFRWTAEGGMEDLNITYASLLTPGSYLGQAIAISPDGRYIVGFGWNAAKKCDEAFLLDTGIVLIDQREHDTRVSIKCRWCGMDTEDSTICVWCKRDPSGMQPHKRGGS